MLNKLIEYVKWARTFGHLIYLYGILGKYVEKL
jgi:hypothetical protein